MGWASRALLACCAFSTVELAAAISIPLDDEATSSTAAAAKHVMGAPQSCSDCAGCGGAASVAIPEGATDVEDTAFAGCVGLVSIAIPASVKRIGSGAFQYTASLAHVNFANQSKLATIEADAFNGCSNLTSGFSIPPSVTQIGDEAFIDCSGLSALTIPRVTSIGLLAFAQCIGECPTPVQMVSASDRNGGRGQV
jgi:hypothetical protein